MRERIDLDVLSRVEGEGGVRVRFQDGNVDCVEFRISEAPRFFEALLQGRMFSEAPDVTARICGICPVAYQMSACHALETVFGVTVDEPIKYLRRLLYCGEWIASHALHMFLMNAPDLFEAHDAFEMSVEHPQIIEDGLRIKELGNQIMHIIGGRAIHPVNVRVGGFHRLPDASALEGLLPELRTCLTLVKRWTIELAQIPVPKVVLDVPFVGLRHDLELARCEGRVVSDRGLDLAVSNFEQRFDEQQVEYSTALHARLDGLDYLVGPLARINLNFDRLGLDAVETANKAGFEVPVSNPFRSFVARGIEVVEAIVEAIRIIQNYRAPAHPHADFELRAGLGTACTEAPRGILYHRYAIDACGRISNARIVPPTSQNQGAIEADLRNQAVAWLELPRDEAALRIARVVRNYDPCISCATHAVQLEFVSDE